MIDNNGLSSKSLNTSHLANQSLALSNIYVSAQVRLIGKHFYLMTAP